MAHFSENSLKINNMKNFYFILLVFCSLSLNAQKVDYDNASKWFWGLNVGGTWQSTDVSNKTGAGWGLIIGKSFNYNYGKPISFDLRGRYLNGNWYGQDKDSTQLTGLIQGNNALYGYQNGLGYTYHNYKSNVHRLALELAIHLNAITQRTGWDPYIFGGIGLTWNKTYGNLTDSTDFLLTEPTLYNYSANGINNIKFDKSYETALDGYSKYRVNFMPSLGFGLGYHIGKRTTLGIEHKTTFTLKDNFDAVESKMPRSKNDLYHYTSLYLNFRLRGRGSSGGSSSSNNVVTNPSNFTTSCPQPVISFLTQNNLSSSQSVIKIQAKITEVNNNNFISFKDGNNVAVPFTYNPSTKNFEATVTLSQGVNTFNLIANNNCGRDSESITINYISCNLPSGNYTNPMNGQVSVQNSNFVISALLVGVQNASNISLFQNGNKISNPSFNQNTGVVQANVVLQPGVNNFRIDLSNPCGNNSISTTVNYNNCTAPNIQLISPSASGSTVNNGSYIVNASVSNLSSGNLQVTLNGVNVTNFTNVNGQLSIPLNLANGNNTITIRATNNCGTDTETTSINYQNCSAPVVTINQPTMNAISTVALSSLKAKVENVANKQAIKILLNNINVPVFNFNASTKLVDANVTLSPGINTITISSTNSCGADIETIIINYDNCKTPLVDILNTTNQTQTSNAFTLNATIQNMPSTDGLILTQNGTPINYSFINGNLSSAVSLIPGVNTFKLTASRSCGNASETIVVNYNDCVAPSVLILNPTGVGSSVNNSNFTFKASALNITNNQQINFKFNGQSHPFTFNNGQIEANVSLINGNNVFLISVTNSCGNDTETSSVNLVNCVPPQISVSNPNINPVTVTNTSFTYQATISGVTTANAISFKLNGQTKAFNYSNGVLITSLNLTPGNNNISISATNECGVDIETSVINYDNCMPPVISFTNPTQLNITTTTSQFNIQAQVTNSNIQGITLTQNGVTKNFKFTNNSLSASLTLLPGNNTIALSTTNSCGNDIQFINVTYNNCIEPSVSITHPSIAGNTVNVGAYNFEASVQNIATLQGITLTHNGNIVSGVTLNNGQVSATVNLISGLNSFSISATNACGNTVKSTTVNYNNCSAPTLSLTNPQNQITTFTNGTYNLTLVATNIENVNQVSLTQNGVQIQNVSFSNGQISALVTLVPGINNFFASATNSCGNDATNFSINYDNCISPSVSINNTSTTAPIFNPNYQFSASIQNINSSQGISLSLNGTSITNFNFVNGLLTANVILIPGLNSFVVSVQNSCGNNIANLSVNYDNCSTPVIHVNTNPVTGSYISSNQLNYSAQILNYNSNTTINLSINGSSVNSYSNNNGIINHTINLPVGQSSIILTAINGCGSDISTYTVNRCENATASLINPLTESSTSTISSQTIKFNVSNVSQNEISISQNGTTLSNFSLNSNTYQGVVNLVQGVNSFVLFVNTPCNQITKTIIINYQPVPNPSDANSNVNSGNGNSNGNDNTNNGGSNSNTGNGSSTGNNGGNNSNNGHGNNEDGVDVSNPGQGGGGPNGSTDQSGNVDDESNGNNGTTGTGNSGSTGNNSNGNSGNGNGNDNTNNGGSNSNTGNGSSTGNNGGNNSNNGHGNNEDGVDVSNPGQGGGGPNGSTDQSGNVDDESNGDNGTTGTGASGSTGNNSNGNSGNGNSNGNNNPNNGGSNSNTGNGSSTGSGSNGNSDSNSGGQTMFICHTPPENPTISYNLEIPISEWLIHQAHGDVQGDCMRSRTYQTNSNTDNNPNNPSNNSNTLNNSNNNGNGNGSSGNNGNNNGGQKPQQNTGNQKVNPIIRNDSKPTGVQETNKPSNTNNTPVNSGAKPNEGQKLNSPNTKPQVTNKPVQNAGNKPANNNGKLKEKPKEAEPKGDNLKGEQKINGPKKGGGK